MARCPEANPFSSLLQHAGTPTRLMNSVFQPLGIKLGAQLTNYKTEAFLSGSHIINRTRMETQRIIKAEVDQYGQDENQC